MTVLVIKKAKNIIFNIEAIMPLFLLFSIF